MTQRDPTTTEGTTPIELVLRLPPLRQSASSARQCVEGLGEFLDDGTLDTIRLLVSELVTNSVRHAGHSRHDPIDLEVRVNPEAVRVEVADHGVGFRPPRDAGPQERASGWGLVLVERLAARWGVENEGRTRVWFELEDGAAPKPA